MGNDQQIATIKNALAAIDTSIAQTEAALRTASNPDDIRSLTSALVDLRSERSRLQAQLDNLESALSTSSPIAGATLAVPSGTPRAASPAKSDLKLLHKQLGDAITDRSVVDATLKVATGVVKNAKRLRMLGDNPAAASLRPKRPQ
jgi:hypothetical protein